MGETMATQKTAIAAIATKLAERGFLDEAKALAKQHHMTMGELLKPRFQRHREIRNQFWMNLREYKLSYPEIGWLFGVCHTTVMSAINGKGKR